MALFSHGEGHTYKENTVAKYVNTFYRVANRAYMYDRFGNEYTGEQLMLALLLHTTGERTMEAVTEVAELLDDPNINKKSRSHKK